MKRIAAALSLVLSSYTASADCWQRAGNLFNIEPVLLYAIAQQESALNPSAVGRNRDGSRDLGLMQINSRHLPRLRTLGIREPQLLQDACLSVIVGASILSDMMKRHGYSWEAVGAYNAGSAPGRHKLRMRYARQVWQRYNKLRMTTASQSRPLESDSPAEISSVFHQEATAANSYSASSPQ